jgi:hypothetical protein
MKALKTWFEDAWWSWGNCINFRFDKYEDNIDRLAFFEEIVSVITKNTSILMMIGIIPPYHQNDNCDWGKDQNLLLLRCIKVSQENMLLL